MRFVAAFDALFFSTILRHVSYSVVSFVLLSSYSICNSFFFKRFFIPFAFVSIIFLLAELNEPSTNDCFNIRTTYTAQPCVLEMLSLCTGVG